MWIGFSGYFKIWSAPQGNQTECFKCFRCKTMIYQTIWNTLPSGIVGEVSRSATAPIYSRGSGSWVSCWFPYIVLLGWCSPGHGSSGRHINIQVQLLTWWYPFLNSFKFPMILVTEEFCLKAIIHFGYQFDILLIVCLGPQHYLYPLS